MVAIVLADETTLSTNFPQFTLMYLIVLTFLLSKKYYKHLSLKKKKKGALHGLRRDTLITLKINVKSN